MAWFRSSSARYELMRFSLGVVAFSSLMLAGCVVEPAPYPYYAAVDDDGYTTYDPYVSPYSYYEYPPYDYYYPGYYPGGFVGYGFIGGGPGFSGRGFDGRGFGGRGFGGHAGFHASAGFHGGVR
jgi:hypothetical protein